VAQPLQQQPVYIHDLKEVCEKSSRPCRLDDTTVDVNSRNFGRLRISRCAADKCGELFVYQYMTEHEMPLHVVGREDRGLADVCWNAYRVALEQEGRADEPINLGGVIVPVFMDL
jgi:hypothetical protein